jgi:hypothetical protein
MKYEPEIEVKVFLAIRELGEATKEEVLDYLKDHEKLTLNPKDLSRYVGRWKSKKIIAVSFKDGETVYKLADVPAWYTSGIMAICKGTTNTDMREALDGLNERIVNEGRIIQPRSPYSDFHSFKLKFETIDKILGGWKGEEEGNLVFPRSDGKLFVPSNWFKGWIRDNAGLVNLVSSVCYHLGIGNGKFLKTPKMGFIQLKVKVGLATYEYIESGSPFEIILRYPMKGTTIKSEDELKSFFKMLEEAPIRGFGANPFALGGRIRLVEMTPIQ